MSLDRLIAGKVTKWPKIRKTVIGGAALAISAIGCSSRQWVSVLVVARNFGSFGSNAKKLQ